MRRNPLAAVEALVADGVRGPATQQPLDDDGQPGDGNAAIEAEALREQLLLVAETASSLRERLCTVQAQIEAAVDRLNDTSRSPGGGAEDRASGVKPRHWDFCGRSPACRRHLICPRPEKPAGALSRLLLIHSENGSSPNVRGGTGEVGAPPGAASRVVWRALVPVGVGLVVIGLLDPPYHRWAVAISVVAAVLRRWHPARPARQIDHGASSADRLLDG